MIRLCGHTDGTRLSKYQYILSLFSQNQSPISFAQTHSDTNWETFKGAKRVALHLLIILRANVPFVVPVSIVKIKVKFMISVCDGDLFDKRGRVWELKTGCFFKMAQGNQSTSSFICEPFY